MFAKKGDVLLCFSCQKPYVMFRRDVYSGERTLVSQVRSLLSADFVAAALFPSILKGAKYVSERARESNSSVLKKLRWREITRKTKKCDRCPPHDGENRKKRPRPDAYKNKK